MRTVKGLPETRLVEVVEKIFKISSKCSKIRCILQGFADRSVVAQVVEWFIKNIQPISVGV